MYCNVGKMSHPCSYKLIDKESTEKSGKLVSNILKDQYYLEKIQVFPIQIMKKLTSINMTLNKNEFMVVTSLNLGATIG
jgi:hypothetical protein